MAINKLNSTESLVSEALNDMEISHEEFITVLNEKNKYDKMKEKLKKRKWKIRRKNWKKRKKYISLFLYI